MRKKWCISGIVLIIMLSAASADQNASSDDSTFQKRAIKSKLIGRTRTGLLLSGGGAAITVTGLLLPFVGDLEKHPGALMGTSVGMTFTGSTAAAIGTSVIYHWGRDHVRYLPSTRAWLTYKIGVAGMFSGLILTAVSVASGSATQGTGFGVLVFMGGEVLMTVASVQSLLYCTGVLREYKKNQFEYFVMPTMINNDSFGLTLQMTF